MKVTFSITELQQRLGQLALVIGKKSQEVLNRCVHIYTENGAVYLQGVDVDTTMTLKLLKATIQEEGSTLTEYAQFMKLVVPRRSDFIFETIDDNQSVITNVVGKARALVGARPAGPFTALNVVQGLAGKAGAELNGIHTFGLPGLKEQIEQVEFAIPPAGGKFTVPSILIDTDGKELKLVATDGVCMAISTRPADMGTAFKFTMPEPTLDLLKKLDGGTTVRISENENSFFLETDVELVTYNKTHAEFPPYERVIPKAGTHKTTIVIADKESFREMLETLTPQCSDQEHPRITYNVSADGTEVLCVSTRDEKQSTGNTYFDTGEHTLTSVGSGVLPNKISLDAKVLVPFIGRATFPVTIHITSQTGVVDMHAAGGTQEKPTYRYLQMPMRGTDGETGYTTVPIPFRKK